MLKIVLMNISNKTSNKIQLTFCDLISIKSFEKFAPLSKVLKLKIF